MKILSHISLILLLVFTFPGVYAQPSVSDTDKAYGLDPLLYNGKFYTYIPPSGSAGTPFLNGPDFTMGSVTLRGITYNGQWLKYDVFNKQLILKYKTNIGADNQIVISDAWLESFNIYDSHFEILALPDTLKLIYQVIGTGSYRVIYAWSKEMVLDNPLGAPKYLFLESKKETYLLTGYGMLKYKNNRSFIALFAPDKQTLVKKHLRERKIKVAKASMQAITELINYCNTLSPE